MIYKWASHYGWAIPGALGLLVVFAPDLGLNQYWMREFEFIAVYCLIISGTNLTLGFAGELQFSQIFMFALGAYVGVIFSLHCNDIVAALVVSALAAGVVGAAVAFPALRVAGWALAMASFLLVVCIPDLAAIFGRYTGGLEGITDIPVPRIFGIELGTDGFYRLTIVVMIVVVAVFRNTIVSRYGNLFRVLRESPVLCESLGFSVFRLKVAAYVGGAVPAGIAGCLYAFLSEVIYPTVFTVDLAIGVVAVSILGGAESIYGAIVGAIILQLGPQDSIRFQQYSLVVYGGFLIVAGLAFRGGISGVVKRVLARTRFATFNAAETIVGDATGLDVDTRPSLHAQTAAARSLSTVDPDSGSRRGARSFTDDLSVIEVSKSYGTVRALKNVSLVASAGEVTALIGANGSGKTTLLNLVCGFVKPDSGRICIGTKSVTQMTASELARLGVRRTFQTPIIPRGVTSLDVVSSGGYADSRLSLISCIGRTPHYRDVETADRQQALALLRSVGLESIGDIEANRLPLGTRRILELARALCGKPSVLLLDEVASGLTAEEAAQMGVILRSAANEGIVVVLVEHNFGFVTSVCQTAYVLELGEVIASGPAESIGRDPAVVASFLGNTAESLASADTRDQ